MLLALDLGNTNLAGGLFEGSELVRRFRVPVADFSDLPEKLKDVLDESAPRGVDRIALASVNPPWRYSVVDGLHKVIPEIDVVLIGRDVKVPVEVQVDHPDEVGADRLLNTLAAFNRVGDACLVADLGTALTLDVVSTRGEYLGGIIAPGLGMSAAALHWRTALLPEVRVQPVERVIGKDTISCIQSGLYWGTVAMLEGLVRRLRNEYAAARRVLATGSDAAVVAERCEAIDEVVPDLTLQGIQLTVERT